MIMLAPWMLLEQAHLVNREYNKCCNQSADQLLRLPVQAKVQRCQARYGCRLHNTLLISQCPCLQEAHQSTSHIAFLRMAGEIAAETQLKFCANPIQLKR